MGKYVLVDCCPVPRKMAPVISQILSESGATLQSCYRAQDAAALLHKCGKHSQTELYDGWIRHLPGYNPANPPGRSTHELRNDGVAYRGLAGMRLRWWQVGIDIDDSHVQAFIRTAAKHGYTVTVTYPGSTSEYHHVNFRRLPLWSIWQRRPLRHGAKGPRVVKLTKALSLVHDPKENKPYLVGPQRLFDGHVEDAVKRFQHDWQQKPDGVVGLQTWRQIETRVRARKAKK